MLHMTPSRGVLVSRMLDVSRLFYSLMQVRPEGVTHGNGKLANVCVRFLREYIDGKDGDSSDDPDNTFPLYLQLESYTNL